MTIAAAGALAVERVFPRHWHILLGGLAGSLVAASRHTDGP